MSTPYVAQMLTSGRARVDFKVLRAFAVDFCRRLIRAGTVLAVADLLTARETWRYFNLHAQLGPMPGDPDPYYWFSYTETARPQSYLPQSPSSQWSHPPNPQQQSPPTGDPSASQHLLSSQQQLTSTSGPSTSQHPLASQQQLPSTVGPSASQGAIATSRWAPPPPPPQQTIPQPPSQQPQDGNKSQELEMLRLKNQLLQKRLAATKQRLSAASSTLVPAVTAPTAAGILQPQAGANPVPTPQDTGKPANTPNEAAQADE